MNIFIIIIIKMSRNVIDINKLLNEDFERATTEV